MRSEIISLHGTWRFQPCGQDQDAQITIPSQWSHGQCWGYPPEWANVEQAWCSREVDVPATWTGRDVRLRFDAVLLKAEVYADDQLLGVHTGGFTPFELDVSHLCGRRFRLRVRVSSVRQTMPGPAYTWQVSYNEHKEEGPIARGIWQNVWLTAHPQVRVESFRYQADIRRDQVRIEATITNRRSASFTGTLALDLQASPALHSGQIRIAPGDAKTVVLRRRLGALPLWSDQSPHLVRGTFRLRDDRNRPTHESPMRMGLREVRVRGDQILLNRRPIRLRGLSLVRLRVSPHMWRRDYLVEYLRTLKRFGFNAVRTHGCIAPPVVYDVADELGILVENQSSIWSNAESRYWMGGPQFLQNASDEFREWIPRDWNHPSVILWDVDNEMIRINPRQIPNVEALIGLVRKLDPTRPVVSSGSAAFDGADLQHLHCDPRNDVVIDRWRANGERKPLIAGEWWADTDVRGVHCVQGRGGMGGLGRICHDFANQADINTAIGDLYAYGFRAYRARGVVGAFAFSPEVFMFDPLYQPLQRINVATTAREPASIPFAEAHNHTEMVSVRRPFLNPGWVRGLPRARINARVARPIRESLTPLLVTFLDHSTSARPGRVRRTLAIVNDTGRAVTVTVAISAGRSTLFSGRFKVPEGGLLHRRVSLVVPDALAGKTVALSAKLGDGVERQTLAMGTLKVFERTRGKLATSLPIAVSAVPDAIVEYLKRRGAPFRASSTPPERPAVWIIGDATGVAADDVARFLQQGGRLLLLRQTSAPAWFALLRFESSLTVHAQCLRGFGFPAMGRELSGVRWGPLVAAEHPVFRGLPVGAELGPWSAGDGRIMDDVFTKDPRGNVPNAGRVVPLVAGKDINHVALAQIPVGTGRLVLCQLAMAENLANDDPEATALFDRVLMYLADAPAPSASVQLPRSVGRRFAGKPVATAEPTLRVVTEQDKIRDHVARLEKHRDAPRPAHTLCIIPCGSRRIGAWRLSKPPAGRFITTFLSRPPLLNGWNAADLDFWTSGACAQSFMPLEPARSPWHDAVIAYEHREAGPRCGMDLGRCAGSLLKWRPVGDRIVYVTTLDLMRLREPCALRRWETILSNAGVPLAPTDLGSSPATPQLEIAPSPELPLDGDYQKWANLQADKNIAPWSRATPIVLVPRQRATNLPPDPRQHGAIGYLLHAKDCLYAGAVVVAPRHSFHDTLPVYDFSDLELFIGGTQIVVGRDTQGRPRYHVHGVALRPPGMASLRSAITLLDPVPDWPDLSLLPLGDRAGLRTCFFELAIPWKALDLGRHTDQAFPLSLQVGIHQPERGTNAVQLVFPSSFTFQQPATYAQALLAR